MASGARRRKRSVSERAEGIGLPNGRVGGHAESLRGDGGEDTVVVSCSLPSPALSVSPAAVSGNTKRRYDQKRNKVPNAVPTIWAEMLSASRVCSTGQIEPSQ